MAVLIQLQMLTNLNRLISKRAKMHALVPSYSDFFFFTESNWLTIAQIKLNNFLYSRYATCDILLLFKKL